jgi:hypothetical protein
MDLDTVADDLYRLAPTEFIAERDAIAARARSEGDETVASQIKKLRRPTVSASLLNALAHDESDLVVRLFEIGEELRTAQARGAGDELRSLMRERQRAMRDLSDAAARLGDARGTSMTAAVAREIQETLLVALSDPDAEAVLRAGRLTGRLNVGDLEPADSDAVSRDDSGPDRPAQPRRDDMALRRAWRDAREGALEARRDADRAAEQLKAAEATSADIDDRLRELKGEIKRLTAAKTDADREVAAARKARTSAERAARTAATRADRAEAAAKSTD